MGKGDLNAENWLNQAKEQFEAGDFEGAIASCNQAIELKPDNYYAWYNRGALLGRLKRHEEAIASYDKAIEIKPDYYEAWYYRSFALAKLGLYEEELASYNKAIELKPEEYQAWYNRGALLGTLKRYEEAIASYDQTIKIKPDYYQAWHNRGWALANLKQYGEAIASYDQTIEIKPDDYRTWHNRGLALANLKQYGEAIASYNQAIEIKPDYYEAWNNRGWALANLKQYGEAIASYNQAIEIKPDCHEAWHRRGTVLSQTGQYEKALINFNKAQEIDPNCHNGWNERGLVLSEMGRYEDAIASYNTAIKIKPDFYLAWYCRSCALDGLGRYEEALTSYDKAIEIKHDSHDTWNNKGSVLCKLERFAEALPHFEKAAQLNPNNYYAWNNQGLVLNKLGKFSEAITFFDKAIEIKPDYHEAWYGKGIALANLKQKQEAIAAYDKAIEIKRDFHEAWYERGVVLANLKQYEDAIASYDKVIELKPDYHEVWNSKGFALARLERFSEALPYFEKATQLNPNSYSAWNNQGWALNNLRQFSEALVFLNKALELKSDYHLAWFNQGVALSKLEQLELERLQEAITSWEKAIKLKPDDHQAWHRKGKVLNEIGQYEEALDCLNKAQEIDPNCDSGWGERGLVLANIGEYKEAIASYDKALELKPDYHNIWINRGFAIANVVKVIQAPASPFISTVTTYPNLAPTLNNLNLNLGGYEGQLATYQEGLKHCPQNTHPEGCGKLHQAIGNAHYFRGCRDANPNPYWRKAFGYYNKSLETLTPEDFSEAHLEVLQELIRTLLALEAIYQAQEFQRRGTDVLHNLLKNTKSPAKKKQLALKFAAFQQLTVDLAVQSGDAVQALELAEAGKNACLSWLLASRDNEISSPTWEEMQQLLNPTTAIVYWHISPAALHTFILKDDNPLPIVLGQTKLTEKTQFLPQIQRLRDFEAWVKDWNQDYSQYRQKKDKSVENNWRDNLPKMLQRLAKILDIPAIIKFIQTSESQPIQNLILIPHRDLHRFPLHALFNREEKGQNFTISYLPSAQFISSSVKYLHSGDNKAEGRRQRAEGKEERKEEDPKIQRNYNCLSELDISLKPPTDEQDEPSPQQLLSVEVAESDNLPPLSFVAFEAEVITQLFENPQRIQEKDATTKRVEDALENKHRIFHFAGHGNYNFAEPLNSELALAKDDKLTLREIYQKDLATYQLVSLSACETAITGNQTITTEYVGLVSGFLSKGVRQVVSTLWTVKSAATALVMIEFYRRWQAGKSEVQALVEATQWLKNLTVAQLKQWYQTFRNQLPREEGKIRPFVKNELYNLATMEPNNKPYEHPYYWAAFIITGKLNL